MGTVTVGIHAELGGRYTIGDAVLHCPPDRHSIPCGIIHIGEGIIRDRIRGTQIPPQEGDHLGPVAQGEGTEGGGGQTVGDLLLHGPQDGLVVEVTSVKGLSI